ncbi:MAG: DUF4177 domain-containing protein [Arenimonas sp.]
MTIVRWAYQVVELKGSFMGGLKAQEIQDKMNQMGQSGWELVSVFQSYKVTLFFKRPV